MPPPISVAHRQNSNEIVDPCKRLERHVAFSNLDAVSARAAYIGMSNQFLHTPKIFMGMHYTLVESSYRSSIEVDHSDIVLVRIQI